MNDLRSNFSLYFDFYSVALYLFVLKEREN